MTSIEDWSLSTLSSHIFQQNLRFGGGPSWKATGLQLQSANSWFVWWQTKATATTAIWELEFWVVGPVGKWATTAIWVVGFFWWQFDCNVRPGFSWRRALENYLAMALSTLLSGQPMYVLVYCAAVSGSEME